jgi:hypothetical protein
MKKIYKAQFKFTLEYDKRLWYTLWLFKKTIIRELITRENGMLVLAETEDEAVEKFKARSDCWNGEMPYFPWGLNADAPNRIIILDKHLKVIEDDTYHFETLRTHLRADEFLVYCRQYLIDPMEAING